MARKIITLSLFNRPQYTVKVLTALAACKGVDQYTIVPVIDQMRNSNNQQVMREILIEFFKNTPLKIDSPRFHQEPVGCNNNIYTCLNTGFLFTDFVIHLEDDILLAPDALEYFEWANTTYRDNKSVFTVDVYNNEALTVDEVKTHSHTVCRAQSFKPWGWATWIDRWENIKEHWQFGFEPRTIDGVKFEGGGWDVAMKKALRKDRLRIYPKLARSYNIGAQQGAHTPSEEFHWAKHKVEWWAGNVEVANGEFKEV